jgi:MoaA/NifB/PqqE/SkfB family radical SAM enzyme
MLKSRIKEIILAITYECNSRCQMCSIWKKADPERISLEEIKKIPGNLKDINITGGEPFLNGNILEILRILNEKSPDASLIISSNGLATELIASRMEKILEIKPDIGVAISIDGIGEKHDEIRGVPGGFEKSIATIKKLEKIGVKKIRLSFTLGDYNTEQLKPVYELSEKLGVEMSLTLVHSSQQYFNTQNFVTKKEKMAEVLDWLIKEELSSWDIKRWLRAYYAFGMKSFVLTGQRILPDYSGQYGIFIDPLGNIFPSDVSEHCLGNIKKFNFNKMGKDKTEDAPNWMICTARQAIKKHWFKVGIWIIKNKFLNL